jgi:hypothetical protein
MTRGALIFAHNNRDIDYALMSLISGGLVKKHLEVPVSLVTDESTIAWMKTSKIYDSAVKLFDQIILVEKPKMVSLVFQCDCFLSKRQCYKRSLALKQTISVLNSLTVHYFNCDCNVKLNL